MIINKLLKQIKLRHIISVSEQAVGAFSSNPKQPFQQKKGKKGYSGPKSAGHQSPQEQQPKYQARQSKNQSQISSTEEALQKIQSQFKFKLLAKELQRQQATRGGASEDEIVISESGEVQVPSEKAKDKHRDPAPQSEDVGAPPKQSKKSELLRKLEKIPSEKNKSVFNSYFRENETIYLSNKLYDLQQQQNKSIYQMKKRKEGETGINNIFLSEKAEKELNHHLYQQEQLLNDQIQAFLGINQLLSKSEKIQLWREKLQFERLDFTEHTMGVKQVFYPGSKKGPHPEDDPEHFRNWYIANMPLPYQQIMEKMAEVESIKKYYDKDNLPKFVTPYVTHNLRELHQKKEDETIEKAPPQTIQYVNAQHYILESINLSEVAKVNVPDSLEEMSEHKTSFVFMSQQDSVLPPYPDFTRPAVEHSVDIVDKWSIFRVYPNFVEFIKQWYQLLDQMKKGLIKEEKLILPTIYPYYYSLPEVVRDNLVVKNAARCLEKTKHDLSLQDKQLMLNLAASTTMPFDELFEQLAIEVIDKCKKFQIKIKDEDKFLAVEKPFIMMTPAEYEKFEKSIDFSPAQSPDEYWPIPPSITAETIIEEIPSLPLHYYDNDDGFWDDFIKQRDEDWSKVPVLRFRPFFKH